jgi:preprotein translocase subunit SecG
MLLIFGILIILACVLLGFFVLIQNPKGGGLSGTFGGFGNQVIGVRQTTDVLEKGTWILAAIIAVLCLTSTFFVDKNAAVRQDRTIMEQNAGRPVPQQQQSAPATLPAAPQQQQQQQPAPKQ